MSSERCVLRVELVEPSLDVTKRDRILEHYVFPIKHPASIATLTRFRRVVAKVQKRRMAKAKGKADR